MLPTQIANGSTKLCTEAAGVQGHVPSDCGHWPAMLTGIL